MFQACIRSCLGVLEGLIGILNFDLASQNLMEPSVSLFICFWDGRGVQQKWLWGQWVSPMFCIFCCATVDGASAMVLVWTMGWSERAIYRRTLPPLLSPICFSSLHFSFLVCVWVFSVVCYISYADCAFYIKEVWNGTAAARKSWETKEKETVADLEGGKIGLCSCFLHFPNELLDSLS